MFALFFVTAQALERLLEPVSAFVLPTHPVRDDFARKREEAVAAVKAADADPSTARLNAAQSALIGAAAALAQVDRRRGDRIICMWTVATVVAMFASAALKLYFLRVVGVATGPRVSLTAWPTVTPAASCTPGVCHGVKDHPPGRIGTMTGRVNPR